jgi:hypothetical protein
MTEELRGLSVLGFRILKFVIRLAYRGHFFVLTFSCFRESVPCTLVRGPVS